MTARKRKSAASVNDDTPEVELVTRTIDRALKAARLADDAASDIETIKKEHYAFIERLNANTKNVIALAIGALVGAMISVMLAGLVYFRSVNDLRENAQLQAETLTQLMSQTMSLQEIVTQASNQQGSMADDISLDIKEMTERISREMHNYAEDLRNFQPQMASGINSEVSTQITKIREDMMGAIADLDLNLTGLISNMSASGSSNDFAENALSELISEMRSIMRQGVQSTSQSAQRRSSQQSSNSPQRQLEVNPYTYP